MARRPTGQEEVDLTSPEITELFNNLQEASSGVDGGAARLGLLDLVTVGQVSST